MEREELKKIIREVLEKMEAEKKVKSRDLAVREAWRFMALHQ